MGKMVNEILRYRDERPYDLFAYCVMSKRVHLISDAVGRFSESTMLEGQRENVSSDVII